jgi:hypothetical protein
MSLVGSVLVTMAENSSGEQEDALVPLPPYVYGLIAFSLLMVLLLVVTRLDLDR